MRGDVFEAVRNRQSFHVGQRNAEERLVISHFIGQRSKQRAGAYAEERGPKPIGLDAEDLRPGKSGIAERSREKLDGWGEHQSCEIDLLVEYFLDLCQHSDGQQGIAAQLEEIFINTD